MLQYTKKILINIIGVFFLLLGLTGMVLPVLPGLIFVLIGLYILSSTNQWAKRYLQRFRSKYPKASQKMEHFLQRFLKIKNPKN